MRFQDPRLSFFEELRLRAASLPNSRALAAPDREPLTYGRLWSQIESIAEIFAPHARRVIAVSLPDGPDLAVAILGISFQCLCAPLNPKLPAPELQDRLSALAPAALIVEAGETQAITCAEHLGIQVWELCSARGSEAGIFELLPRGPALQRSGCGSSDAGLLLHTSATTGRPKLVPLSHSNLRAQCLQTSGALALTSTDTFLSLMPLFHLQGILAILAQLYSGGGVICAPGFDVTQFQDWLDQFWPTWYTANPTMHRAILTLYRGGRLRPPQQLRFVRSIGAPLPLDLIHSLESALGAPVIEGYGLTEVGAATSNPLPPGRRKPGSVGISTGAEVAIFDASGYRVAPGVEGEIRIGGAAVTAGYWNDSEATRSSFRDGWLQSGDLGRFDEEGYLYVTGRAKEVVNRGGEKIMPQEIDVALTAHPDVAEAAGFGVPHPTLGEDIVAVVVRRSGASITERELREFLASLLAAFKVPRRILFVDRIPKGATGKPRRMVLREEFGTLWQPASLSGASELELSLAEIWKRILQTEVGLDDDFFAAGGDSLAATVMLAEVRAVLAVDASLLQRVDFFENPTIRSLARIVSECGNTAERPESALIALQPNGSRRPLFLLPDASSEPYYFRGLAKHLGKNQPTLALRYASNGDAGVRTVEGVAAHCRAIIRSVQPHGPYLLAGHCFGGIVAFETARQMIAAGEEVELLALLDTTTPGFPKAPAHWRKYARALRRVTAREAVEHVRYLATRARLLSAARWRRRVAVSPNVIGMGVANETAGRNYSPQPVTVRVLQFIASDQHIGTRILDDPRLEWRRFALSGFESHATPGDHLSILFEPNVQSLAAQLGRALCR